MQNYKMMIWTGSVVSVVAILIALILSLEPEPKGISRAEVSKALALGALKKEECIQKEEERENSAFSEKERGNWFVKYMDYLYEEEIFDRERTPATLASAQSPLTYEEAVWISGQILGKKDRITAPAGKKNSPIPAQEWWTLYERLLPELDPEGKVRHRQAILYGTPSNIPGAASWTAYTTQGMFDFQGLVLDAYMDHELSFYTRDDDLIGLSGVLTDEVTYKNVWLSDAEEGTFHAWMGMAEREFGASDRLLKDARESETTLAPNLADLHLKEGKISGITIKKEKIRGKILSVTGDAIELEGYGEIPLDENFRVYRLYGEFQVLGPSAILAGYDLQEFIAADGKLCAALLEKTLEPETIRVLLMDTGYQSLFHSQVRLTVGSPAVLSWENKKGEIEETELEAGTSLTIGPDEERLKYGRMTIHPQEPESITLHSLERTQGTPVYSGSLEIKAEDKGLVLVNELDLEEYLRKVVPSEMPPSYELEALKAQAVCARTYAFRQIQANTYVQYGAHVDDSTNFQVYNNISTNSRTDQAIRETAEQMLYYQDSPIEAYYYSTSCGMGSDGSVWGTTGAALPYLRSMKIRRQGTETTDAEKNSFDSYIRSADPKAYESEVSLFRWTASITEKALSAQIRDAGRIQELQVTSRGAGGIANELMVRGDRDTIYIRGQSAIRSALGSESLVIRRQDGTEMTGSPLLPSAFISIEKQTAEDGTITFRIYGGGYGHGAGMSQNAAQYMAKDGNSYRQILDFFYHGAEVK